MLCLAGSCFISIGTYWLTLLLSFVPLFVWGIADQAGNPGELGIPGVLLGSLALAGIHTAFAAIGMAIAWLTGFRKILLRVLAAALAAGILIFYDGFNGNPAGKWLAEQTVRSYLAKTYPDRELLIRDGGYNFKFHTYEFRVVAVGTQGEDGKPEEYGFTVRGVIPKLAYDPIANRNL